MHNWAQNHRQIWTELTSVLVVTCANMKRSNLAGVNGRKAQEVQQERRAGEEDGSVTHSCQGIQQP